MLGDKNYHQIGDAWTFIAIERNSKVVLCYKLGKRNMGSTMDFVKKLAVATSEETFQLTSDGFSTYPFAVETELGGRVDYAQSVKIYKNPTPEEQRRYSPCPISRARLK